MLLKHPGIIDAAVIGIPEEHAGEVPKAFVVKRPGTIITEEDVVQFTNSWYLLLQIKQSLASRSTQCIEKYVIGFFYLFVFMSLYLLADIAV